MHREMWERIKEEIQMSLDEANNMGYDKPTSENFGKFYAYQNISRTMARIEAHVASKILGRNAREYLAETRKADRVIEIKTVIFNDPATIVIWLDGSKTVVKCQPGDTYSKETGLALCIAKKYLGNKGNYNEVFKKWIPEKDKISVKEMRDNLVRFCRNAVSCSECPLYDERCGRNVGFMSEDKLGNYRMSDDEIKSMFAKAFRGVKTWIV